MVEGSALESLGTVQFTLAPMIVAVGSPPRFHSLRNCSRERATKLPTCHTNTVKNSAKQKGGPLSIDIDLFIETFKTFLHVTYKPQQPPKKCKHCNTTLRRGSTWCPMLILWPSLSYRKLPIEHLVVWKVWHAKKRNSGKNPDSIY